MKVQKKCRLISQQFILNFSEQNELSQTTKPLQVSGAGGLYSADKIPYQLSLAKDHPKGEEPTTIKDDSKDFIKFKEALDLMKDEKQVLILVDNYTRECFHEVIAKKLPRNSYTEHHKYKADNDGAAAWVEHHLTRQEEDEATNKKFKFLIGDWRTTAGYEVPAVIYVTNDLKRKNMATQVQRAKAKLIMYENQNFL